MTIRCRLKFSLIYGLCKSGCVFRGPKKSIIQQVSVKVAGLADNARILDIQKLPLFKQNKVSLDVGRGAQW
jgi:hypothetical protein